MACGRTLSAAAVTSVAEPTTPERKIIIVDKPGAPQTVLLAFGLGVPRSTADYPSILIMNDVLGGLFSSRINMNLREQHGYTYGAFSDFAFNRFGGPLYAGAQVRTDVTAPAAKELFSELDRITTDPPTAAELKLAQDSQMRSIPGQFETAKGTSRRMGQLFVYKLPDNYYATLPAELAASETTAGHAGSRGSHSSQADDCGCRRRSRENRTGIEGAEPGADRVSRCVGESGSVAALRECEQTADPSAALRSR